MVKSSQIQVSERCRCVETIKSLYNSTGHCPDVLIFGKFGKRIRGYAIMRHIDGLID